MDPPQRDFRAGDLHGAEDELENFSPFIGSRSEFRNPLFSVERAGQQHLSRTHVATSALRY